MQSRIRFTKRKAIGVLLAGLGGLAAIPAAKAQTTPSAEQIEGQLSAAPSAMPKSRMAIGDIKRQRDRIIVAPSIDIQSINFEFGAARIPQSENWKIKRIAIAMRSMLRRNPREIFLIEGHTDAVGSRAANYGLSNARANSVSAQLRRFGIPRQSMETLGLGEDELLVPTQAANWQNRRVTLRRITDFVVLR